MSEYWVSKKKYFCKYCEIYIADDAPSRQQHENGLRHKGNVERFIRGLYKGSERRKKDQDEEKREMARVEHAAQAAYHQDVAAGLAKPGAGPASSSSSVNVRKPSLKPSSPFVNYSTAASLGYTDPDAERFTMETERRRTQGVAGDWEVVTNIVPSAPSDGPDDMTDDKSFKVEDEGTSKTVGKREAETPPDEDDARRFKLRKKDWVAGLGGVYNPAAIPIKLKMKEKEVPQTAVAPEEAVNTGPVASTISASLSKWKEVQWRRPGEGVEEKPQDLHAVSVTDNDQTTEMKQKPIKPEDPPSEGTAPPEDKKPPLTETDSPPLTGMFRKRKVASRRGPR